MRRLLLHHARVIYTPEFEISGKPVMVMSTTPEVTRTEAVESLAQSTIGGAARTGAAFDPRALARFLNVRTADDTYALVIPKFEGTALKVDPSSSFAYTGEFFVAKDARATIALTGFLAQAVGPLGIELRAAGETPESATQRGRILIGSISNGEALEAATHLGGKLFSFDFTEKEWAIVTAQGRRFAIESPIRADAAPYGTQVDYGLLARMTDAEGKTTFLVSGLGSIATEGTARYLARHWTALDSLFGTDDFAVVTQFMPPLDPKELHIAATVTR